MTAYYNEIDPFCAQWLRNLISAGHIAPGDVDERSIEDVRPDDLQGYDQCHFFAGIGVWSHALRLAKWPDSGLPVWTGSCPCQPFSAAGKGAGFADERHLWPAFFHLISECRPSVIFGEQVAGRNGLAWLDLVSSDVEGLDYACGAVVVPAAGFGAPHIRERLYWVAHTSSEGRRQTRRDAQSNRKADERGSRDRACDGSADVQPVWLGDAEGERRNRRQDDGDQGRRERTSGQAGEAERMAQPTGVRRKPRAGDARVCFQNHGESTAAVQFSDSRTPGERPGPTNGVWRDADWLLCTDGKWRPVEPGTFPLADGVATRVGRLRAYGNAIVAPQATAFIEAAMEYAP